MRFSDALLPFVLVLAAVLFLLPKKTLLDAFLAGAREGLATAVSLLPTLVLLLVGVGVFRASGAAEALATVLAPLLAKVGVPAELVPLLLVRPVSGGGATALAADLFQTYGADSFPGLCASVLMGCSDTVLYIVSVYYGSVGVRRSRHTLPAALLTMLFCIFFSCLLVRIFC